MQAHVWRGDGRRRRQRPEGPETHTVNSQSKRTPAREPLTAVGEDVARSGDTPQSLRPAAAPVR